MNEISSARKLHPRPIWATTTIEMLANRAMASTLAVGPSHCRLWGSLDGGAIVWDRRLRFGLESARPLDVLDQNLQAHFAACTAVRQLARC
jgi:hypothetical protein